MANIFFPILGLVCLISLYSSLFTEGPLAQKQIQQHLPSVEPKSRLQHKTLQSHGPNHILVTGALGCIGTSVVKDLMQAGHHVTILDISDQVQSLGPYQHNITWIQGDIRDRNLLAEVVPTVTGIIHLAAMSRVSWCAKWAAECVDINVKGTKSILDAALDQENPPWVVHASSREVYGGLAESELPVTEDTRHFALNVYGRSKVSSERVVHEAVAEGLSVVVVRFSNVYGCTRDYSDRVIPNFVQAALSGRPLIVSGSKGVDFTYVDDAAKGVVKAAMKSKANRALIQNGHGKGMFMDFNLASGRTCNLDDVAMLVVKHARSSSRVAHMTSDPEFVDKFSCLLNKSRTMLGYDPRIEVDEGIRLYVLDAVAGKTRSMITADSFRSSLERTRMLRLYQVPLTLHHVQPLNTKIIIVDSGICGVCAGLRLQELGHTNWVMLENDNPDWGLPKSHTDSKGFIWDVDAHGMGSQFGFFETLLDTEIPASGWAHHAENTRAYMNGHYYELPAQSGGSLLRPQQIVDHFAKINRENLNTGVTTQVPESFKPGTGTRDIERLFTQPYTLQVWGHEAEGMDAAWHGPSDLASSQQSTKEGRSPFRYPIQGIGHMWETIWSAVPKKRIRHGTVAKITTDNNIMLQDGTSLDYDFLISSIPINTLLGMVQDSHQHFALNSSSFQCQTLNAVGIGIEGALPSQHQGVHFLYFPGPEFPFYRLTFLSNLSPRLVPGEGYYSVLAEVSESRHKSAIQPHLVDDVIQGLRDAHILQEGQVVSTWKHRRECGNPIPYKHRDRHVNGADSYLKSLGIFSRGKLGGWKYETSGPDHVCNQGIEAVDNIVLGLKELGWSDPDLVNTMHRPYPAHTLANSRYYPLSVIDVVIAYCDEDLAWLPSLTSDQIPSNRKFNVFIYERCGAKQKSSPWDAMYHIQRIPAHQATPVEVILTHLLTIKFDHASEMVLFLDAERLAHLTPPDTIHTLRTMKYSILSPQTGFDYIPGEPQEMFPNLEKYAPDLYSALLNEPLPHRITSQAGSQFLVATKRIQSIPAITWTNALKLTTGSPAKQDILAHMWHVLFGDPPE